MNRKEILLKRNKIGQAIEDLKKQRGNKKEEYDLNNKIEKLKGQYIFYNELLKTIGGKNDN